VNKKVVAFVLLSLFTSGCAHVPPDSVVSSGPTCMGCAAEPRVAYAVSTPGPCNNYPVTYRVQVPAERDKVLPVDQVILSSSTGSVVAQANTACYTPR
jgi:hypothetical protein